MELSEELLQQAVVELEDDNQVQAAVEYLSEETAGEEPDDPGMAAD